MVRLVDTDLERPQLTAAIDEALLDSRMAGDTGDTVHLYRRRPPSVSIGYFQEAASVADLEACRRAGVPVVRRISAGGAIFTDERQLVYAIVHRPAGTLGAREGLALACLALVRALGRLGVDGARMEGDNDVVVGGRKVSGSAQRVRRGVHLVHGTVLVDVDMDAVTKFLRPPVEEVGDPRRPPPARRITTLATILGRPPPMADVKAAVAGELARALGGVPEPGSLTGGEASEAARLDAERYSSDAWNLRR